MAIESIRNIINRICCYRFLYKTNERFFQGRKKIVISNLAKIRTKIGRAQEFKEYLSKIDLESRENYKGKSIGFIVAPYEWGDWYQYSINLAVMLYKKGYDIEILVDDLPSMEEQAISEGITDISVLAAQHSLELLEGKMKISYLSKVASEDLDESEVLEIQKIYDQSLVWLTAHTGKDYLVDFNEDFLSSAKRVKKYILTTKCDTINVYTGIHFRKGVYNYFAQQTGLRCSTYDSLGQHGKTISFSCNGPQAHCTEIDFVINTNMLAQKKREILEDIYNMYSSKMNTKNTEIKGDVLIPLNIMWDAAALNVPNVFSNFEEWLLETVEYIVNNTSAIVVVREHPHKARYPEFYYEDLEIKLHNIRNYDKSRVIWISAEEEISTYDYIKQCKLIIPYTTTVGIEAVYMGKNVICSTDNYYVKAGIAPSINTKQEYFEKISEYLDNPESPTDEMRENAALAIALHKNINCMTKYCEINTPWTSINFEDMVNDEAVRKALLAIAENIPYCYSNLLEGYER